MVRLRNRRNFHIDKDKNVVHLSGIFDWFGEDFISRYGTDKKFLKHKRSLRAVLNFIARHLEKERKDYLLKRDYKIKFIDYNWTLNEQ